MLVMIDGRTVYTPIYSGVFWDQNEVLLDDIERIEVIRGPGATMWGANAVNGVLNVITKKAESTIGKQITVSGGTAERGTSAQYGARSRSGLQSRVFLTEQRRLSFETENGNAANDGGNALRGGGRLDWRVSQHDWMTLHGDLYRGRIDQRVYVDPFSIGPGPPSVATIQDKSENSGGYSLLRWEHNGSRGDYALQAYYNSQNDKEYKGYGREGTADIDFQHHFPLNERNDVMWGLGYRNHSDHLRGPHVPFSHSTHQITSASSFLQDELCLIPSKLVLTAGTKLQWNSYTHLEVQPSLRFLLTTDNHHSAWASVSRSVRTPSIRDRDLFAYFPLPSSLQIPTDALIMGNPHIKSEVTLAYEGGYRQQVGKLLSADFAGFLYSYSKLVSQLQEQPFVQQSAIPMLIVPVVYANDYKANSQGAEAFLTFTPTHSVRLASSYTWTQARIAQSAGALGTVSPDLTWSTPRNTINLRGSWDFRRNWTMNGSLGSVSETPIYRNADPLEQQRVPAYRRVDLSTAYSLGESVTLSAGAHNLQEARHLEFNPQDEYDVPSEAPRSAYMKLVWSF
jgi:iron complex outermembrane receptor protein